jgi:hypothetical protein
VKQEIQQQKEKYLYNVYLPMTSVLVQLKALRTSYTHSHMGAYEIIVISNLILNHNSLSNAKVQCNERNYVGFFEHDINMRNEKCQIRLMDSVIRLNV